MVGMICKYSIHNTILQFQILFVKHFALYFRYIIISYISLYNIVSHFSAIFLVFEFLLIYFLRLNFKCFPVLSILCFVKLKLSLFYNITKRLVCHMLFHNTWWSHFFIFITSLTLFYSCLGLSEDLVPNKQKSAIR